MRELMIELSRLMRKRNAMIRARDYTVLGAVFPGSVKPVPLRDQR